VLGVPAIVRRHAAAGAGRNSAAKDKQRYGHSQLQLENHANLHSSQHEEHAAADYSAAA
jgi:hypothetical protein